MKCIGKIYSIKKLYHMKIKHVHANSNTWLLFNLSVQHMHLQLILKFSHIYFYTIVFQQIFCKYNSIIHKINLYNNKTNNNNNKNSILHSIRIRKSY